MAPQAGPKLTSVWPWRWRKTTKQAPASLLHHFSTVVLHGLSYSVSSARTNLLDWPGRQPCGQDCFIQQNLTPESVGVCLEVYKQKLWKKNSALWTPRPLQLTWSGPAGRAYFVRHATIPAESPNNQ